MIEKERPVQTEDKRGFDATDIRPDHLQEAAQRLFESDIQRMLEHKNDFVYVNCPACNADDADAIFIKYEMQFRRCRQCETVYVNNRPTLEILDIYYSNSELYEFYRTNIFPASEEVRREKIFNPRMSRLLKICRQYKVEQKLLIEVGAGFGLFSELIVQGNYFNRVIAVERSPDMAASCRQRSIEVIEKPIEEVDLGPLKAQVVVSFEVIEHLFHPMNFIVKCASVIEPGGLIILTCPNSKGFDLQILGKLSHTYDGEHLNYFTPYSLTLLLERCGFDVCEVMTPGELDAEFVRKEAVNGEIDLSEQPFLKQILIDEWERVGDIFQQFLQNAKLSSHMWIVARRRFA